MRDNHDRVPFVAKTGIAMAIVISMMLAGRYLYIIIHGHDIYLLEDTDTPTFYGTDHNGQITNDYHPEKETIEILQSMKETETDERKHADYAVLISSIDCSFSTETALSNGDTVEYACTYNPAAASHLHLNLLSTSKKFKISSLEESKSVDFPRKGTIDPDVLEQETRNIPFFDK